MENMIIFVTQVVSKVFFEAYASHTAFTKKLGTHELAKGSVGKRAFCANLATTLDSQYLCKGGRRKVTPKSCPLTYAHACACVHTLLYTQCSYTI